MSSFPAADGGASTWPAKSPRELCFLCGLLRMPWAMVHNFSENVCRGCLNYEGAARLEHIIQAVRVLKVQQGVLSKAEPSRAETSSANAEPLLSPGGVIHLTRTCGGGVTPVANVAPSTPPPQLMSPEASLAYRQGMVDARVSAASTGQKNRISVIPGLSGKPVVSGEGLISVKIPGREERKPVTAALNFDYTNKPPHIVSALQGLAKSTPFEVRLKSYHSERGRVFAFDAKHRFGTHYDLDLFIEYPMGSGQVYKSPYEVAKLMGYKSEQSPLFLPGFKYLEYEVRPDTGDWRLLEDLLPETVRYFKEPVKEEFLPVPKVDPNYSALPKVSINFSDNLSVSAVVSAGRNSPKRKKLSDMSSASVVPPTIQRATLTGPPARRRKSLSVSFATASASYKSPAARPASAGQCGGEMAMNSHTPGIDLLLEKPTPSSLPCSSTLPTSTPAPSPAS